MPGNDALVKNLKALEAPVADITMIGPTALGAEFVRWEIATAVAGALLEINPFDEPNVAQAKHATHKLLGVFKLEGQMPVSRVDQTIAEGVTLTLSDGRARSPGGPEGPGDA